jgi:(1->4)-alpha-D-glucan 1-alpha-D-glucosylmutase
VSVTRGAHARSSTVIPRATYRLQLNSSFTFNDATALVPYLAQLGISHVYCSPYFRARPGSVHGYDVVDHNALNPEIGTREDFEKFIATLRSHGMGHILDFVPNHVGIMGADNAWWMHVLENGKASGYADYFDIDWYPPNPSLADRLLVPALGDPYGSVLERGELQLRYEATPGSFAVFYFEHRFPIDPSSYPLVMERAIAHVDDTHPGWRELENLISAFRGLPDRDSCTPERREERERDKEIHKERLAALLATNPPLRAAVETAIRELNGTPGDGPSYDALHELLERQCYRLAYWRVAAEDINYRRFFDVNDLAALRMENPAVFDATHGLVLELVREGKLDGLRIDHPDGLYDPARYFAKLQQRVRQAMEGGGFPVHAPDGRSIYLLAEKITASFERLPLDWVVHGTTGYAFANMVNGLFVDARARTRIDRVYRNFIGDYVEWDTCAHESKVLVLRSLLAAELNVLANQLARIAESERHTRDFTLTNLRRALIEIIAAFPVYRTYVSDAASDEDRRYIDWAIARTRSRSSWTNLPLLQFVRAMMLADTSQVPEKMHTQVNAFARKFQQVTSPVTAKGVEDTALYRFTRLASLNEVGGEPENFGTGVRQFHADARYRARHWPHAMVATSTHDTKRAEDVRARMAVLSELSTTWRKVLRRWSHMNRSRRRMVDDLPAPGPHAEYLLYQTLLGTWPLGLLDESGHTAYLERIEEYMVKAAREAKRRTSWANVNEEYEEVLREFIRLLLERRDGNAFPGELDAMARRMAGFGFINSMAQTLCKLTAPGVPDIYQGNEIWDWSLVDPDNRRPVDYQLRRRLLNDVASWRNGSSGELSEQLRLSLASPEDGRCKLHVTWTALNFRRKHEALFRDGEYLPLRVSGKHAAHVLAYARKLRDDIAIIAVPRLCARLLGGRDWLPLGPQVWADTRVELPRKLVSGGFQNLMDGCAVTVANNMGQQALPVADLLLRWPCALLVSQADRSA